MLADAETELHSLQTDISAMEYARCCRGGSTTTGTPWSPSGPRPVVDASDFAERLMRMYLRWAERHGYPTEVYDTSFAEEAGIKSATFAVKAPYAYGTLSVEQGTHRLVRISPFDNQAAGRPASPGGWMCCR